MAFVFVDTTFLRISRGSDLIHTAGRLRRRHLHQLPFAGLAKMNHRPRRRRQCRPAAARPPAAGWTQLQLPVPGQSRRFHARHRVAAAITRRSPYHQHLLDVPMYAGAADKRYDGRLPGSAELDCLYGSQGPARTTYSDVQH